ncbi:hypothetical protein FH972_023696 [Carpinus fangiana]|uniref:Uncharacterized protein n=1 Tax=Carpinus fangiana TaxID=176857 RepID=A0A5N6KYE2_9ROSI|nr:hypothetical protein FH972_023696 [Carpinus fangiana]
MIAFRSLLLLAGCGLLLCFALPNELPQQSGTELATRSQTRDLAVLDKRNPWAVIAVAQAVGNAISWAVAIFSLVTSAYSVAKDCVKEFNRSDCVLSSIGLVISAFGTNYKYQSLKLRVRDDGLDVHGFWEDPLDKRVTHELHIPALNGMLFAASIATSNNGTWARHATRYVNGEETHHLLYRKAVKADLGFENDGSYHHYRVQDAHRNQHVSLEKRLEKRTYKVVSDYLWKNNGQGNWQAMHDAVNVNDMAYKSGKYFQDNNLEAGCLVPIGTVGSHGGSSTFNVDQGVLAYGWNDKPFDFDGRSGGWINQCHYA